MSSFEDRLNWLESKVKAHDVQLFSRNSETVPPISIPATSGNRRALDVQNAAPFNEFVLQEEPLEDMLTDGMAITFVSEDDSGFFGSSSNIAFMRHITRSMEATGRGQLHTPSMNEDLSHIDNGIVSVSRPVSLPSSSPPQTKFLEAGRGIYCLPPDNETRDLLRRYFSNTGLLFPFIHEPTFFQEYEDMRSETIPKVRRTWLGLLNMVLAMASSTSADFERPAAVRRRESDVFYQRAHELCRRQMLRGASLETGMWAKYRFVLGDLTTMIQFSIYY
jgi:hypothetical protein